MNRWMRVVAVPACAVAVAGMLGCASTPTSVKQDPPGVQVALNSVSVNSTPATLHDGAMPTGDVAFPAVAGVDSFTTSTPAVLTLTVPDTATALMIGANDLSGYLYIPITGPVREAAALRAQKLARAAGASSATALAHVRDLVVVVRPVATFRSRVQLVLALANPRSFSRPVTLDLHPAVAGAASGQLLVTLDWSAPVDLDLHVQVPSGEDIYYGNRDPGVGGSLVIDSNSGCVIDNLNSEVVSWGANVPATGRYIVRVDYWSRCGVGPVIPYVVTVRRCGVTTQYPGRFTSYDVDGGGAYAGQVVATLDIAPCGTAPALASRSGGATPH